MEVPLLVTDFLDRAVRLYPEKTAIVDGDLRLSYRDFDERVDRLSNALLGLGLEKGDRVCILSPNSHFFLESFYATAQTGLILVPLNYRLVAADHEYILNHAGVSRRAGRLGVHARRRRDPSTSSTAVEALDRREGRGRDHPDGWTDWNELVAAASDGEAGPSRDRRERARLDQLHVRDHEHVPRA